MPSMPRKLRANALRVAIVGGLDGWVNDGVAASYPRPRCRRVRASDRRVDRARSGDRGERNKRSIRRETNDDFAHQHNRSGPYLTATEHPFIQAVMDVESPTMATGRVCLLGDAAFAARPHAAAGTAKAAENAWTLADAIEAFDGDLPGTLQMWSGHQTALGSSLVARTRHIGEGSQFRCDWRPGDAGLRFGLYEPGDSSIWTRVPRAVVPTTPNAPHNHGVGRQNSQQRSPSRGLDNEGFNG